MQNIDLSRVSIAEVMSKTPLSIGIEAQLYEAEQLMLKQKVKAILVVDAERKLQGIIDIFE